MQRTRLLPVALAAALSLAVAACGSSSATVDDVASHVDVGDARDQDGLERDLVAGDEEVLDDPPADPLTTEPTTQLGVDDRGGGGVGGDLQA